MSTTAKSPTGKAKGPKPARKVSKAAKVGWGVYQQIAAVLAAFGIAAMLGHFWDIGWRGFLQTVVGVWDTTVRPAAEWLFHVLVSVPLSWLGLEFEVPLWARDYLSVGLVLLLSILRSAGIVRSADIANLKIRSVTAASDDAWLPGSVGGRRASRAEVAAGLILVWWPLTVIVAWPLIVVYDVFMLALSPRYLRGLWGLIANRWDPKYGLPWRYFFALMPLIYLALLLAVNFWVMPHI